MTTEPEFSRTLRFQDIDRRPREVDLVASPEERAALAERFQILAVDELTSHVRVERETDGWYRVRGSLQARVVQECVRTLAPVPEEIDEPVALRVTTDPDFDPDAEDADLTSGDEVEYVAGEELDVGELLAQQLALALNPYPRSDTETPDGEGIAVVWDTERGANSDGHSGNGGQEPERRHRPFTALADLVDLKKN